jgi:hypothetical protein
LFSSLFVFSLWNFSFIDCLKLSLIFCQIIAHICGTDCIFLLKLSFTFGKIIHDICWYYRSHLRHYCSSFLKWSIAFLEILIHLLWNYQSSFLKFSFIFCEIIIHLFWSFRSYLCGLSLTFVSTIDYSFWNYCSYLFQWLPHRWIYLNDSLNSVLIFVEIIAKICWNSCNDSLKWSKYLLKSSKNLVNRLQIFLKIARNIYSNQFKYWFKSMNSRMWIMMKHFCTMYTREGSHVKSSSISGCKTHDAHPLSQ